MTMQGTQTTTAMSTPPPATKTAPSVVQLNNVEKVYRTDRIETVALSDIHMDVRRGELISVMGPSGSGKSTLLNILGLLDEPTGGTMTLDSVNVESFGERRRAKIRNEGIGFIFQTFHLISDLSVMDNVQIPLLYRRIPGAERRRTAEEALDRVGRPKLLLADEPTGNLDSQMGNEIMELLESYNRDEQITVVMVTHDQRLADRTERIVRLFDGRQVQ